MYLDDIFVYLKIKKDYIKYVKYIFPKLQKHDLKIKLKEC